MKSVIEQSFGINIRVMEFLRLYPPKSSTRLYRVLVFIMFVLLTVPPATLGTLYFILEDINMASVADNAFVVASMICYFGKLLPFITNGNQIKRCIHYFEFPLFTVCKNNQKNIINESVRICRRNNTAFFILVVGGYVIFAIKPLFLGYYKLPLDVWLPFDFARDRRIYYSIYLYLVLGVGYPVLASAVIEPLIGGLACLAAAHLQVLKDNLQHLEDYTEEEAAASAEKSHIMYDKIKQYVEYHDAVIFFVKEFEESFSPVVFNQLVGAIFVICFCCLQITMLEPMSLGFFQMVSYFCIVLTQIYFYCYYGTTLFEQSSALTNSVYSGNWYEYDIKSRKALIILMERSKRPMVVTAGKLLDLSLDTFGMILRRSYSLLAVLKNY